MKMKDKLTSPCEDDRKLEMAFVPGNLEMNYLHYELDVGPNDIIRVTLDKQVNVKLLDSTNYQNYRTGQRHRYYGGLAKLSPVDLRAPYQGHWHLVIDLGGYAGTVNASVNVMRG